MMTEMKKKTGIRFAAVALVAAVVIYAIFQMISLFSRDVEIARLRWYTTEEKIESTAMFFRDETVISSVSGSYDYAVDDGTRVAIGDKIATVYSSGHDTGFADQLAKLEAQLDSLSEIYESGNLFDYDVSRLDEQINDTIYHILQSADSGIVRESQPLVHELAKLMNKRSILDGNAQVTLEQINGLRQQIAQLEGSSNVISTVYSSESGFFTSQYDGFEGSAPLSAASEVTVNSLNAYLNKDEATSVPSNYVGSVINGFEWKCAFLVPADQSIQAGNNVRLRFPEYSDESIRVMVTRVSEAQDGQVAVVVSSVHNIGLHLGDHKQSVEIISSRFSGYYVNKAAVKFENGVTGVYVLKGKVLSFQPVTVVYSGDDYVLLTGADIGDSDDVIVAGRDLYDGKVIKGT
jgi:putative membrane fusion protein